MPSPQVLTGINHVEWQARWKEKRPGWHRMVLQGRTKEMTFAARDWCNAHCSAEFCYHVVSHAGIVGGFGYTVWLFRHRDDALHFKLRWY